MQLSFEQTAEYADKYSLNKLVFINSAYHCFTEIDINHHLVVLGKNNKGKTSILNALKLFLLPEDNMNACESKFAFRKSEGGYYNKLESYQHYFTDNRSFIVLEAENRYGKFCQILHRKHKECAYGRLLLAQGFDSIRHLFWNKDSHKNGGLGEIMAELSFSKLEKQLKALGAESLTDRKEIRELLFQENFDLEKRRYCILPFAEQSINKSIEAFRNLFQLAYDISSKDRRTLPKAVAAVLEGEKQHEREHFIVDFDEILREKKDLIKEKEHLQLCISYQTNWQELHQQHQQLMQVRQDCRQVFYDIQSALEQALAEIEATNKEDWQQGQLLLSEHFQAEAQMENKKTALNEQKGKLNTLQEQQQQTKHKLEQLRLIQRNFPNQDFEQIAEKLTQEKQALEQSIQALADQANIASHLEIAHRDCVRLQAEIKGLEHQIKEKPNYLPDYLADQHSKDILISLNPNFAYLSQEPDEVDKLHIQNFTQLFQPQQNKLLFLNERLQNTEFRIYQPQIQLQQLEGQLERAKSALKIAEQKRLDLNQALSSPQSNLRNLIQNKQQNLNEIQQQLSLIKDRDYLQKQYQERSAELPQAEEQLQLCDEQYQEALNIEQQKASLLAQHKQKTAQKSEQNKHYQQLAKRLDRLYFNQQDLLENLTDLKAQDCQLDEDIITQLEDDFVACERLETSRNNGLLNLLNQNLLQELDEDRYQVPLTEKVFNKYYQGLFNLYQDLEHEWQNLENRISAHAKNTNINIKSIEDAGAQIRSFETELNQEFSQHQISDLQEIKVRFELHPNFEQLINELNQIDRSSHQLPSEKFYLLLENNLPHFFKGNSSKHQLNMESLIEKVSYICHKRGEDKPSHSGQSTGTSTMINCLLLSSLLKRLMRKHTRLSLPLVLDEIDRLDEENLHELVKIAERYGFVIFGTCPTASPKVISAVNHHVDLSYFSAEFPYNPRNTLLYHGDTEQLLQIEKQEE